MAEGGAQAEGLFGNWNTLLSWSAPTGKGYTPSDPKLSECERIAAAINNRTAGDRNEAIAIIEDEYDTRADEVLAEFDRLREPVGAF